MTCPICNKRKAKRFCPAKGVNICSVCCGTEREVTIDCPADCTYLMASRRNDAERQEIDWSKVPFSDTRIPSSFVAANEKLILAISYAICANARENSALVDADVVASLKSLAEAYRTLSSGLYYENPPEYLVQRQLYDKIKVALEDFRKTPQQGVTDTNVRDSDIRDVLIFLTQLGTLRSNSRPKGRPFLDFLRSQFKQEEFGRPAANLVVLP